MEKTSFQWVAEATEKYGEADSEAFRNRYIILGIILTGILMAVLDGNVVGIALPTITNTFRVDLALSQWTATAYLLTVTSLLLVFGKLSEYTGKVKMYIAGFALFTLGSLACALAPGIYELIGFRVLQGIGGAMVSSIGAAIIFLVFPPVERGRAMGFIGAVSGIGCIAGPVLGGFMVEHFGWGSVFMINVPIGAVLILAALRYLKVQETRTRTFRMDWIGAVSLTVTLSALLLFLGEAGFGLSITPLLIAYAAAFILGLATFVVRETRTKAPLLDLSAFSERKFTLPLCGTFISFTISLILGIVAPFYFQGALHYTPSYAGALLFIPPAIMIVGAPLGGVLVDRYPWKYYSALGMAVMALAFVALGFATSRLDLPLTLLAMAVYGLGNALFTSPNSNEVMSALPRQKAGIASSASALVRNLGMALGISLGAVIMTMGLSTAGSGGAILASAPASLASAASLAMYFAAALCVAGAITSWLRYATGKAEIDRPTTLKS